MNQPSEPDRARPPIVRLVDLHKSFGRNEVLHGIDLQFETGRTTVVMGPSGCGKSVMIKHINGLLRPTSGEVWFEDIRVDALREARLGEIRKQIGFLFQQGALFDSMSVRDNIAFPLREHTDLEEEQIGERVLEVLEMVGLVDVAESMPADLSGGQSKRAALARAVVLQPKLILYDEPTTGLDPIRADVITELILKLQESLDVSSIVVTHDLASAFKIADVMVMLYDGTIILRGTPEQFRQSKVDVVQRFLHGEATAEELAAIRLPNSNKHARPREVKP